MTSEATGEITTKDIVSQWLGAKENKESAESFLLESQQDIASCLEKMRELEQLLIINLVARDDEPIFTRINNCLYKISRAKHGVSVEEVEVS